MYTIRFQPERSLLDIAWHRIFLPDQVPDYARQCLQQFLAQGLKPGYLLRMDMRESAVQPRDTLDSFSSSFRDFPKASRIAVITASALQRMQVLRVMTQPYLRVFDDADSGLDWLLDPSACENHARRCG
ncbi:STAS/SEC14 domain-containing protein [Sphingomonas sp.]|uniref:STAS/SEC14 domain-containing protein n=1 Tax=Sphingomonas sp. TaxID=28214 RepID=UPI0028B2510E|nr:STAS/SEC14 domain-containing protein [Sphingomonas sp.]